MKEAAAAQLYSISSGSLIRLSCGRSDTLLQELLKRFPERVPWTASERVTWPRMSAVASEVSYGHESEIEIKGAAHRGGLAPMDSLTLFGLFAVTAMLVCYALEDRGHWFVLAFAGACALGSAYGFLQGAWPFGLVEAVWAVVAVQRWRKISN